MFELKITDLAADRMLHVTEQHGIYGLKLGIKKTGCAGLEYTWDTVNKHDVDPDDRIIAVKNTHLVVDRGALKYLHGSTVDYVSELFTQEFRIANPNAESQCGCGISLSFNQDTLDKNIEILELK